MATQTNNPQPPGSPKVIRLVRPSIVVLCGPAACGKTTFAEKRFRATQIISSDWARGRVCDDERDQRFQAQAFGLVHYLIEERLTLNRLCVVDSTALTPQARKELLSLARKHHVPCFVFVFEVPLEKCVERDAGRERTVGRPVIERQYQLFEQAKASIPQEGFDQVYEFGEEEMESAQIEMVFRPVTRPAPPPGRPGGERGRRPPRPAPFAPPASIAPSAAAPAAPAAPPASTTPPATAPAAPAAPPASTTPAATASAAPAAPAAASARPSGVPSAPPAKEAVIRDLRPVAAALKPLPTAAPRPAPPSTPPSKASVTPEGDNTGATGAPAVQPQATDSPSPEQPPEKTGS